MRLPSYLLWCTCFCSLSRVPLKWRLCKLPWPFVSLSNMHTVILLRSCLVLSWVLNSMFWLVCMCYDSFLMESNKVWGGQVVIDKNYCTSSLSSSVEVKYGSVESQLIFKVLNFWKFTRYCSLKPLWSGMGEVVPVRTSPTLHPPSPPTVHQLSWLAL